MTTSMLSTTDMTEIKYILDNIIEVLSSVDEPDWLRVLQSFRERAELPTIREKESLLSDIIRIYGGMGSFNDLVLYKNDEIMINETTHLDELRRRLFEIATNKRSS